MRQKAGRATLAASPDSLLAHLAKGNLLRTQYRFGEAIPEYEMVLASNPNAVFALDAIAQGKFNTGSIEEALPLLQQAIRLSPAIPPFTFFVPRSGASICCNRVPTKRSSGSKKRAAPSRRRIYPRTSRLRLRPQRRDRMRRRGACRGPKAKRQRSLRKPGPRESRRLLGGVNGPRLVRSEVFRRAAQGRHAGRSEHVAWPRLPHSE